MASILKHKIANAASSSSAPNLSSQEAEKYRLMVTAGPSYDQSKHHTVRVNDGQPTYIENDFLRAKISVNIRQYRGLPSSSPSHSAYFDDPAHEKDLYSISFSFVPKIDLPSMDTVWGNDFDHPVRDRLPPGFNTAFRIVKEFIDPGLQCDAYADEPWLYGPSLSCWFAFRVGDKAASDGAAGIPGPQEGGVMKEGADGTGEEIRQRLSIPDNNEKRRKYFLSASHRQAFTFEKGRCYRGDFYNPYIDFGNFALKLPGFSLKVIKYVDQKSHCLRYVFKDRKTGDVYFNVNFHLLWGEKLAKAIRKDEEEQRQETQGAEATSRNSAERTEMNANGRAESTWGHDTSSQASAGAANVLEPGDGLSEPADPVPGRRNGDHDVEDVPSSRDQSGEVVGNGRSTASEDNFPEVNSTPAEHPTSDHGISAADCGTSDEPVQEAAQSRYRPEDHRRYGNHDRTAPPASDDVPAGTGEADDHVDEITKMLVNTSTSDRRNEKYL